MAVLGPGDGPREDPGAERQGTRVPVWAWALIAALALIAAMLLVRVRPPAPPPVEPVRPAETSGGAAPAAGAPRESGSGARTVENSFRF